jgi:hypothetical protein
MRTGSAMRDRPARWALLLAPDRDLCS